MKSIINNLLSIIYRLWPVEKAYAHCDIPCGIYDPHGAQIGALTVIRMMDLMHELEEQHQEHDEEFRNSMMRCVMVKEKHAEMAKHEVRVIWGDYFKPEIAAKYPELHLLVHEIMQAGSKAKQTADRVQGEILLKNINRFAEIFWDSKGLKTQTVKAPYKPEELIIRPVL